MKRTLKVIGIVIAILVVVVLILPFVINVNDFRPRIESELTNALGRKVTVGNLSLSLISGSLAAENISIADDPAFGSDPFIRANALNVGVEIIPLIFSKTLHVTDLTPPHPKEKLPRDRSEKWNFSPRGSASPKKKGKTQTPITPAPPAGKPAKPPRSTRG